MKKQLVLLTGIIFLAACSQVSMKKQDYPFGSDFAITWRYLYGLDGETELKQEFRLTNNGSVTLPADGWVMYFNFIYGCAPGSESEQVEIETVNGNFRRMYPTDKFTGLPPGETAVITFNSTSATLNKSAIPQGFYFVFEDSETPQVIRNVTQAAPIKPEQGVRNSRDVMPVPTAESRFAENINLYKPEAPLRIVPKPVECSFGAGMVTIGSETTIWHSKELAREAGYLSEQLQKLTGHPYEIANDENTAIIRLKLTADAAKPESYRLLVNPEAGITISGGDQAGVFYGILTLLSVLPVNVYRQPTAEIAVPAVDIIDYPRFGYRGLHIDVARNFHSLTEIKKFIDLLSFYKLNRLHLHLTDDEGWRLEIADLPELTTIGARRGPTENESDRLIPCFGTWIDPGVADGYYSRAEYIEILQYARERHISVIPEFDFPGHARAAIIAMEARHHRLAAAGDMDGADQYRLRNPADTSRFSSAQKWTDNVVDVGMESVYDFLMVVFDEVIDIYQAAGVELPMIHIGGDEVPHGSWTGSPTCADLLSDGVDLQAHFLGRVYDLLQERNVGMGGWEEIAMRRDIVDGRSNHVPNEEFLTGRVFPYTWNNVAGWGGEDLGNILANAGFPVVLCSATNLYLDMAYDKSGEEPGLYWAGFVNTRKAFEFTPLNIFNCITHTREGVPVDPAVFVEMEALTAEGKQNIIGIQGQLWSELLINDERLEYMAFPKAIALAERAWSAQPEWAEIGNSTERNPRIEADWDEFAYWLGQRELPRLDHLYGGVHYRIPPPGGITENGILLANALYPGLAIRYTTDGSDPTIDSPLYSEPVPIDGAVRIRAFNKLGRSGYTVDVKGN